MMGENVTKVSTFILVGFPVAPGLQYLASLHRPMYYFLSSMSLLELWYVSDIIPKMLEGFLLRRKRISFVGCMTQLYFFCSLVCTECVLLASTAYDRYVVICHPLHYHILVTLGLCLQLVGFSFVSGFTVSTIKVDFISSATFCGSNVLNHFFCDISLILKLARMDFSTAELVFPLLATVLSYGHITLAVLRIPSATGHWRASPTCASHLAVVTVLYVAMIFMYVQPQAIDSQSSNKLISAVYTIVTPIINPLIYCLRNKEFKDALKKALGQTSQ
uniref:Olfactory receptor n=1 Tax=Saimiri boliviensis boliviensis TaxID=39432 RepID=A0A2K6ULA5_SAIBB